MNRKTISIIIAATMLLSGCRTSDGELSTPAAQTSSTDDTVAVTEEIAVIAETIDDLLTRDAAETTEASPDVWNPIITKRQDLSDQGYLCAVAYIGYTDPEMSREQCAEIFSGSRYADELGITEMPLENCIVDCGGYELYLVFPTDENATVSVCEWLLNEENDFAGETGEVYYRSETGAPVLIRCNVSDIMPNVVVSIVDSNGDTLQWCPSLSLKDGSVSRYGHEDEVCDLTHYIYNETFECYLIEGDPQ